MEGSGARVFGWILSEPLHDGRHFRLEGARDGEVEHSRLSIAVSRRRHHWPLSSFRRSGQHAPRRPWRDTEVPIRRIRMNSGRLPLRAPPLGEVEWLTLHPCDSWRARSRPPSSAQCAWPECRYRARARRPLAGTGPAPHRIGQADGARSRRYFEATAPTPWPKVGTMPEPLKEPPFPI